MNLDQYIAPNHALALALLFVIAVSVTLAVIRDFRAAQRMIANAPTQPAQHQSSTEDLAA